MSMILDYGYFYWKQRRGMTERRKHMLAVLIAIAAGIAIVAIAVTHIHVMSFPHP